MRKVFVPASTPYEVHIGDTAEELGGLFRSLFGSSRAAVVCDENVKRLHGEALALSLSGICFREYIIPAGEDSKSFSRLSDICGFLSENSFGRNDVIIAVGGGVTGDIAGFTAAVYMRGMRFIQMPTTLLSMTDSSVGGKVAVNTEYGKNLVGAFHQPSLVLCHTPFLDTLPTDIYADGMAEVVKYGVIRDKDFFEKLSSGMDTEEMIARCVEIKRDVVVSDEKECGERVILNFGHTAAHAVEKLSGYKISHGKAVAIGMVLTARCAEAIGVCEAGCAKRIAAVLEKYSLNTDCPYSAEELARASKNDKKAADGEIKLTLPKKIGECTVVKMPVSELEGFFGSGDIK